MEFPNRVDPETLTVVSLITEEDTIYVLAVNVPLTVKFPLIVLGILNAKLAVVAVFAAIATEAEDTNPLNEAVTEVSTKLVTCVPEPLNISPDAEICSKF